MQILYGNLAEKGSVAKISGKEGEKFEGPARVFEGEHDVIQGINLGKIKAGDVIVGLGPVRVMGAFDVPFRHFAFDDPWC